MFTASHYVPILRWKGAERTALKELRAEDRTRITPLIEIPRKIFEEKNSEDVATGRQGLFPKVDVKPDPRQVLFKAAKAILEAWQHSPFFLDLCHIDGHIQQINSTQHPLTCIAEECRTIKVSPIPVTGLRRRHEYQGAVTRVAAEDGRGVCVRVTPDDVLRSAFREELATLVKKLGLRISDIDMLLDTENFDASKPDIRVLLERIPKLGDWRTLTVASGAFPENLQGLEKGRNKIDRRDWLIWKQLALVSNSSNRKPSFSDYTVQFGRYVEPPDFSNPTASIRYTLPEQWLVMKGETLRNEEGPGFAQYPASATLLRESDDFYGPEFSYGDLYISRMSIDGPSTGTPTTWLQAGINHHMTVVSRQIASLSGFSDIDVPRRASRRILQSPPTRSRSIRGA